MTLLRAAFGAVALASSALASAEPQSAPPSSGATAAVLPQDKDERGLWLQADEEERKIANSNLLIRDEPLNRYVRTVFCRTVGEEECKAVRIYIVRTPQANASMMPNGAMQIWSGLFLRVRDEAQLAAVLGHEYSHFTERHTLRVFRDLRGKASAIAWLSFVPFGFIAQIGVAGSVFAYNREMERDADAGSLRLLVTAGYDPMAPSRFWSQSRAEMDATAAARGRKSLKDSNGGIFGTHPRSGERMTTLAEMAKQVPVQEWRSGRDSYSAALSSWWPQLIADQVKLNDFGGTELLLAEVALDGWTPELLYARGELYRTRGKPADFTAAAGFYRQAIAMPRAPDEAWRGLGLALLRSGSVDEGRAALRKYLALRPDAGDSQMIAMLAGGS